MISNDSDSCISTVKGAGNRRVRSARCVFLAANRNHDDLFSICSIYVIT